MALINNIYVLASSESVSNEVEITSHPTEKGLPLSDTIRSQPISISLSGKIANTDSMKAIEAIKKLKELQKEGSLIKYVGKSGTFTSMQIQSFSCDYNNKNFGGADFDMTLKEARIAKRAFVRNKINKVTSKKTSFSEGDKVIFGGGAVYCSSDSPVSRPSSFRGTSTCKLTKISKIPNAKHIYHLISVDGRHVYGWVDKSTVKAVESKTSSETSGGTQQTQSDNTKPVYYTVKNGDTLWGITNKKFREMNLSDTEIMNNNPNAFSKKNNPNTLIAGKRIMLCLK